MGIKIPIYMVITEGAAALDPNHTSLHPTDTVFLYGKPGELIMNIISGNAGIIENNYFNYYQLLLDQDGLGRFNIAVNNPLQTNNSTILVNAYAINDVTNSVNGIAAFLPYRVGKGYIHAYSYTTGAPADSLSSCSIYLMIANKMDIGILTKMVVKVDGKAFIQNDPSYPQLAYIILDSQGCAIINIANTLAESVNVTLALPDSPDGEFIQFKINFLTIPNNFY